MSQPTPSIVLIWVVTVDEAEVISLGRKGARRREDNYRAAAWGVLARRESGTVALRGVVTLTSVLTLLFDWGSLTLRTSAGVSSG